MAEDTEFWGAQGVPGFKAFLLARFGSLIAGWRALDLDGNGRLSFVELCTACRSMGYHGNLRKLWQELDRNGDGHVSLGEIDREVGETIGTFKLALMNQYGDMLTAWRKGLDINGSGRIEEDEIRQCCDKLGLDMDPKKVFGMLASHGMGLTLAEFDPDAHTQWMTSDFTGLMGKARTEFIEDVPGIGKDVDWPADILAHKWKVENVNKPSRRELWRRELKKRDMAEVHEEHEKVIKMAAGLNTVDGLKRTLVKRCGSLYGAWCHALDLDQNGHLSYGEFCQALARLGIGGDVQSLWRQLDNNDNGVVDFVDFDPITDTLLREFRQKCKDQYGNMLLAWMQGLDTNGNGSVDEGEFVDFCKIIGYTGDVNGDGNTDVSAKHLFKLLKCEPGRNFLALRDFDLTAARALSRGDFRMLMEAEDRPGSPGSSPHQSLPSKLEMTFDERMEASFFSQYSKALNASKKEAFSKTCRAFLPVEVQPGYEDMTVLCKRKFGSVVGAWRYCLDPQNKGKLSRDEFSAACRRLGYSGEIRLVWDKLNPDPSQKGFVSLRDLDKEADAIMQSFVKLVDARFGGIDKMWTEFWRKDHHQSASRQDIADACKATGYVHPPHKLFECLAPAFGARCVFLRDLLPLCDMIRKRMALGAARPRAAMRKVASATPSMSALAEDKPEEASAVTQRTPAILRDMMSRVHGNTVAAWCKVFDAQGRGFVTQQQFNTAMPKCELYGNIKGLWKDLTKGQSTLPFKNIDPAAQEQLDACRAHLVQSFGSVLEGWRRGLNSGSLGRLDEGDFASACAQLSMPAPIAPKTLFRLLLARLGQRSISLDDLRPLLVGVLPAEREATWGEPIKIGGAMGSPAKKVPRRQETEAFLHEVHKDDWVPDKDGFNKLIISKYGSLFAAWRNVVDLDRNGIASKKDFFEACRTFGLNGGERLWKEMDLDGKGQITLDEFDAETADMFGEFEDSLMARYAHPREGWKIVFDKTNLLRCDKAHFIEGCEAIGYTQDAARLFKLLQPDSSRHTLSFDDIWLDLNRNIFHTKGKGREYRSPKKVGADRRNIAASLKGLPISSGGT